MKKKVNVNTFDDLFNLIAYNIENNFISYLLSFLTTLEIIQWLNFKEKYTYILQNLETVSDSRILKSVGLNNISTLDA